MSREINIASQKKKSSSQSVSGGVEENSSRSGSKNVCPAPVARSLCEERINNSTHFEIRQKQTLSLRKLSENSENHSKNTKQKKNDSGKIKQRNAVELSEIGSVFESSFGGEGSSPIESLEQVKNLNFLKPRAIANKDMTLEQILQRKEAILSEEMSNFRKKFCKKGYEILHKEKEISNEHAKIIALMVDGMVKTRFPDEREGYISVIKKIFRAIRVRF
jgi:hypothetical protein